MSSKHRKSKYPLYEELMDRARTEKPRVSLENMSKCLKILSTSEPGKISLFHVAGLVAMYENEKDVEFDRDDHGHFIVNNLPRNLHRAIHLYIESIRL